MVKAGNWSRKKPIPREALLKTIDATLDLFNADAINGEQLKTQLTPLAENLANKDRGRIVQ